MGPGRCIEPLPLRRRAALLGSLALALGAATARAPRQDVLTTGLKAGGLMPRSVDATTTFLVTLTLEAPITAFRVAFGNPTATPYRIDGVAFREGGDAASGPAEGWRPVTFERSRACLVGGNTRASTGALNVPAVLWSDWTELRTEAEGRRPQLSLRVLSPPQMLPMATMGAPEDAPPAVPGFGDRIFTARQVAGDFVGGAGPIAGPVRDAGFAPLFAVQYRPRAPGVQLVIGGDSVLAAWHTFARLAAMELSTPALPVAAWNVAWGGQPSRTFWPLLDLALDIQRPSIGVVQGWTANDGLHADAYRRYLDDVRESVGRIRRLGGVAIVVQDVARNLFERDAWREWQAANQALGPALPEAVLFDVGPLGGDPARPGDWRPGFSRDDIHPNLAADVALSRPFRDLLRSML